MTHRENSTNNPEYTIKDLWTDETPARTTLIQARYTLENRDPVIASNEFEIQRHNHSDSDTLNTVLADGSGEPDIAARITIQGCHISVTNTGEIRIQDRD